MADLEKVIKGLECCIKRDCRENACPYGNMSHGCLNALYSDALELLKEQQPTVDAVCVVRCNDCVYGDSTNGAIFECRKHSKVRESKFGISTMFLERHGRGFYCADGERRESE